MRSSLNLIAAAILAVLSGSLAAEESSWVALSSDVTINRTSIANAGQGEKSVWIQRNYENRISLGANTQTGQDIYPHQSVQIQYAVNCAKSKLNMMSWKMFSDANATGDLVWASEVPSADAAYRYSPGTEEEKSVVASLCGTTLGSR